MKNSLVLISLLMVLPIISCISEKPDGFTVDIEVPPGIYDSLSYHLSKESFTAYSLMKFEKELFDSTGHAHFNVETNRIGLFFMTIFPNGNNYKLKNNSTVYLLVRPGETYSLKFDSTYPRLFRISGDYEEAQNLYNQFNNSDIAYFPRMNWYTNHDSLPDDLLAHLEDSIHHSLEPFQDLYEKNKIDDTYYRSIQTQIQYSQADALLDNLELRERISREPRYLKAYKELFPMYLSLEDRIRIEEEIFSLYPPANEDARILIAYPRYIDKYLKFKTRLDVNKEFYEKSYAGKLQNVHTVSEYFDEETVEYYFASQFRSASLQDIDSLATFLYVEFQNRYPESKYMAGVVHCVSGLTGFVADYYPGIDVTRNPDQTVSSEQSAIFPPEIKFLQEMDSFTSFDSVISQFKGKNLYVDFWASWCAPCRYEFQFADSLHQFLQAHNFEILYISKDKDEALWKNAIYNFNLTGNHIMVTNPELEKDLKKIVYFLPTYMIIDSTGTIVEYDAERPHTRSVLYNQLLESMR
jgi:thiol-disulfide isomerase/thioredoxin